MKGQGGHSGLVLPGLSPDRECGDDFGSYANWNRNGLFDMIHSFDTDIRGPETAPCFRRPDSVGKPPAAVGVAWQKIQPSASPTGNLGASSATTGSALA